MKTKIIEEFLVELEKKSNEEIGKTIEKYLDSETIEVFADHIEEFYGIDNDDEIALLTQIMITGFITAKETTATSAQ